MNTAVSESEESLLPIDEGWAWVVLASSFLFGILQSGTLRCFGLFFIQFIEEFQSDVSETAVINSVQNAVYALMIIPVLVVLMKYFSERQISMLGCILTTVGYALSSLAGSLHFLFFSISILVGGGGALAFGPVFVVLGKYFNKRRGLANGVMVSGSCVGSLALPPLIQYFLDEYCLRGALLLTAAVYAHTIVFILLLRPESYYVRQRTLTASECVKNSLLLNEQPSENIMPLSRLRNRETDGVMSDRFISISEPNLSEKKSKDRKLSQWWSKSITYESEFGVSKRQLLHHHNNHTGILSLSLSDVTWINESYKEEAEHGNIPINNKTRKRKLCDLSVFNQMEFILFVAYYSFACIPGSQVFIFIPSFAKDTGLSNNEIVILLGVMACTDFLGRISSGYLADLQSLRSPHIVLVAHTILFITTNCARFLQEFWHFCVFVFAFGLFSGTQYSLCAAMASRILGPEMFPTGLAITVPIQMILLSGFSPILGHIRDISGSYSGSFHLLSCCSLTAVILVLLDPLARKYDKKRTHS